MNKVWFNDNKGDDKLIGISSEMLFKANPKNDKLGLIELNLKQNILDKEVFSIPFNYITSIQLQERKKYIQVFFQAASEEHFVISDDDQRMKIFNSFKNDIPNTSYEIEYYSAWKSANKSIIAFVVGFIFYCWTLFYSIQLDAGTLHSTTLYGSLSRIVFGLANLGTFNVSLIFVTLLSLAAFQIIKRVKNKPIVHHLYFNN